LGNHKNENMENTILPVINNELLQQKANEYAQKGAEKCLEEFYTGYNSPYKKAIEENLKNKALSKFPFGLPDIVGILNDKIIAEFDELANTAIAQTLIPYAKSLLTRQGENLNFSDILSKFIEHNFDKEDDDPEDFTCEVIKHSTYDWLTVQLSSPENSFEIVLHTHKEKEGNQFYQILSLPREGKDCYKKEMKITVGDVKIEVPFTTGLLKNDFTAFLTSILISRSKITMDVTDFDEEMFPRGYCHCD
jgi:hypothetical protein